MSPRPPAAVLLMGPTASGKTDLAVELVRHLPLEIISVDSAMVYRGMDIGTGKPGPGILARAPHRLIDIREPEEPYSAAEFREDALREMRAIAARNAVPLLVGGTGLYFRALRTGLSPLPAAQPEVRRRLGAEAAARGWAALHARLQRVDPAAAARIHPNDPQRIQRALEVFEVSGRPMSKLLEQAPGPGLEYAWAALALHPAGTEGRRTLHARIARRFHRMLELGLVDEVARLRARPGIHAALPSMRAVGYRQVWEYLEGRIDRPTMAERGVAATRQLARRQLTWLRGERGVRCFDSEAPGALDRILRHLSECLE